MENNNISLSVIKVFDILKKLYFSDCKKEDLSENYSDDTLYLYLKTLRHFGVEYTSPDKKTKYYSLKSGLNFLNLTDNDIYFLTQIKEILAQKSDYQDIIDFNNLLDKLKKYTNKEYTNKLEQIISTGCIDIKNHTKIFELEKHIKYKNPLKIIYNQLSFPKKSFKVLPKFIKQEKGKLYLLCADKALEDLRCLKIDRIKSFEKIEGENYNFSASKHYAICEFDIDEAETLLWNTNYEVIEKYNDKIKLKIHFNNIFEFTQKILSFGEAVEVLEPENIRKKIIKQLRLIHEKYIR